MEGSILFRRFILNPIRRKLLCLCMAVQDPNDIELEIEGAVYEGNTIPNQYYVGIRKKDGTWRAVVHAVAESRHHIIPEAGFAYRVGLSKFKFYTHKAKGTWFPWWRD